MSAFAVTAQTDSYLDAVAVKVNNGRTYEGHIAIDEGNALVLENRSGGLSSQTVIPRKNILSIQRIDPSSVLVFASASIRSNRRVIPQAVQPKWIETTGQLMNFNSDVEADGIEVRIVGRSSTGIVPLVGSVDVRLEGLYRPRPDVRARRRTIDRWTYQIRDDHRSGEELVFHLRFRGGQQRDWRMYEWGRVSVRVNSPSLGSWDAESPILLRPIEPYGEELLRQRFLWAPSNGYKPIR